MDTGLLSAFKIVYPKHYPTSVSIAAESKFGEKELDIIIAHYCPSSAESIPPALDSAQLRSEYQIYRPFVIRNFQNFRFDQFATSFLQLHSDMFPEMAKLITMISIIPVTSVPCERGFSASNRIKTKLRNRLHTDTVDNLLRISIEGQPIDKFDFSKALTMYKSTRQHRMFHK